MYFTEVMWQRYIKYFYNEQIIEKHYRRWDNLIERFTGTRIQTHFERQRNVYTQSFFLLRIEFNVNGTEYVLNSDKSEDMFSFNAYLE